MARHFSLEDMQIAAQYENLARAARQFGVSLLAASILLLVWLFAGTSGPFALVAMLLAIAWCLLFGLLVIRQAVFRAPVVSYRLLGGVIGLTLLAMSAELLLEPPLAGGMPRSGLALLLELISAGAFYGMYQRRFQRLPPAPSAEIRAWLHAILEQMRVLPAFIHPNWIEFKLGNINIYKVQLLDTVVVLLALNGGQCSVIDREQFQIQLDSTERSTVLKATFALPGQHVRGVIDPASFKKFQRWKGQAVADADQGLWVPPVFFRN